MKYLLLLGCLAVLWPALAQNGAEEYPADSASGEQPGVPKGELLKFTYSQSSIFPGTWREFWVYVPAQYDPRTPACVYVNQDGVQWKAPTVFDNLIHSKEMPVTIGVFVMHGKVNALQTDEAQDRFNRSFEYDGLGDNYVRFILDELLPEVEKQKTSDGRPIRLSHQANDRAIGGSSSGAVCAFTAAWERPDAFSRVFSAIGTYVGLRGADRYPTLIRKYEPKPLRIYLQDGENDLNIYAGDWWMANQMMLRALTFAGYEVAHQWGQGAHNGRHGTALFPEAMRYLWKGWPAPVRAGQSQNQMQRDILIAGKEWEFLGEGISGVKALRTDAKGNVYARTDSPSGYWELNQAGKWVRSSQAPPFPKLPTPLTGLNMPAGSALSPDHTQLYTTDPATHWVWASQVQPGGKLLHKQRFGWLHQPDDDEGAGGHSILTDQEGRLYVATRLGVQVLDQPGRVNVILPTPVERAESLAWGGPDFSDLYVLSQGKVYRRHLKVRGANAFDAAIKPPKPRL